LYRYATSRLTNWERLEAILQSTGLTRRLLAGAHISDPRSQLTILLCFIEAHERTAQTVFDVFGAGEGADSVEEMMFEREVKLNRAAAERAITNLGLSQDDIRGERTGVMIKMLERELTDEIKSYVSQGIVSQSASKNIVVGPDCLPIVYPVLHCTRYVSSFSSSSACTAVAFS
jgi:hypothetical protein